MSPSRPTALSELQFPRGREHPEPGVLHTLRPGLHWVRMPLPFALDHINLWVLDDVDEQGPCWTLIDAGVSIPAIHAAWQTLWAGPLSERPLGRMLVTHMHPDHVGNAQWLIERFSAAGRPARLWMSASDYLAARVSRAHTLGFGGERAAAYFASHGLTAPAQLEQIRERGNYYATMVPELPADYRRLHDHLPVRIGEHVWTCLAGYGHAPEHMSLYCESMGVLISGDMLLPKISTNVSVTDMEPEADALGLFLGSLRRFESLPADTLVLPSHGHPFTGIHARVAELHRHHDDRLEDVRQACRQRPTTAADLLPVLFRRELDLHQTTFAMGEAVAHLNHLWHLGELRRQLDDEGVWRFSPA